MCTHCVRSVYAVRTSRDVVYAFQNSPKAAENRTFIIKEWNSYYKRGTL